MIANLESLRTVWIEYLERALPDPRLAVEVADEVLILLWQNCRGHRIPKKIKLTEARNRRIAEKLKQKLKVATIARQLDCSRSTIYRFKNRTSTDDWAA